MINLRYHIVSITAIFLALGIGVAVGSTFLDKATVDQLETNIDRAEKRIEESRAKARELQAAVDQANGRDDALKKLGVQELFTDMLTDDKVLVLAYRGTQKETLSTLEDTLTGAGAEVRGTLSIDPGFLGDEDRNADRAKCIGLSEDTPIGTVRRSIADRLGDALADASRGTRADGSSSDQSGETTTTAKTTTTLAPRSPGGEPKVITQLRACGLLSYTPPDGGAADDPVLVGSDYRFVFASNAAPPVGDGALLTPMLQRMADTSDTTATVVSSAAVDPEPEPTRTSVVGPVRIDNDLNKVVSTVDDLESFSGIAATVLALRDVGSGVYGHYGVGDGASV